MSGELLMTGTAHHFATTKLTGRNVERGRSVTGKVPAFCGAALSPPGLPHFPWQSALQPVDGPSDMYTVLPNELMSLAHPHSDAAFVS
ncbi:hypothetical protein TGRH88_060620 [Toxoplasma gondii]|uniref:Uncharacterized protein n=1 Tax=Toxoplasma gondii TaxID=5811 RepID=A0A7J6JUG0_TOXGO|nr:hypothetical protein TGRH88_060620 [Toxoplasma gondii]